MDRRARTPGVALTASVWEVIDRAAIEADLPGILGTYGWRSVRGEDMAHRRVLTDPEGRRCIVVARDVDQRWQWWDTAVMVVGTIVDALTQLLSLPSLRDVLALLRRALIDPPEPLPVLPGVDQNEVADQVSVLPTSEQMHPFEIDHDERSVQTPESILAVTDVVFEQPNEGGDNFVAHEAEAAEGKLPAEEETTDVQVPEDNIPEPPRRTGRRR